MATAPPPPLFSRLLAAGTMKRTPERSPRLQGKPP
jgi:hypothetical protein